jgi:hypothetical protein
MKSIRVVVVVGCFYLACQRIDVAEVETPPIAAQRADLTRPDAAYFDAGWRDDGGILVGCEVPATVEAVPAACTLNTRGCQASTDCDSGLCLALVDAGFCTKACTTSATCGTGWSCQLRWTGSGQLGFCVPAGTGTPP